MFGLLGPYATWIQAWSRIQRRPPAPADGGVGWFRQPGEDKLLFSGAPSEGQIILFGEVNRGPDLDGQIVSGEALVKLPPV